MIEIPESLVLTEQINQTLRDKIVKKVIVNASPHKFAWFSGDSNDYSNFILGKAIKKAVSFGGFVEIELDDVRLLFGDGVALRYYQAGEKLPTKHQLLVEFEDTSVLIGSVQMYGGLWCYEEGKNDNPYYLGAKKSLSPLRDGFDYTYFKQLKNIDKYESRSAKAFLATEQRIPGLGNGVLQDILYNAKIHPKKKMGTISEGDYRVLFEALKNTLKEMAEKGGRDTEKDLFGNTGGYKTKVSKNTVSQPCTICNSNIIKEAYLGGSIYYCPSCQK